MTVRVNHHPQPIPTRRRQQAKGPSRPTELPGDALRPMLQALIQEPLEAEFTRFLGAAPHERTAARRGWRNGTRGCSRLPRVGSATPPWPRDRAGEFQPSLFARYQRSEQALVLARAVFRDVAQRGLTGVWYVVSDEHEGLVRELRRYFPD